LAVFRRDQIGQHRSQHAPVPAIRLVLLRVHGVEHLFHLPGYSGRSTGAHGDDAVTDFPAGGKGGHLTDAQIADLIGGLWYASIQTHANPNGEIRGQVVFNP
jgi:hypothetical protein